VPYSRLIVAWLILAVAMPLNGALREFWLKSVLSPGAAEAASALLGVLIILAITHAVFRIAPETPNKALWQMSFVLITLTIKYEFAVGLLGGQSWQEMAANYAIWRGRPWPLVLLTLGLTPFIWRPRRT